MRQKSMEKRRERTEASTKELTDRLKAEFRGYVNFEWTDAQKEAFAVWALEFDFWSQLNAQTERGRKISVGYDAYHHCQVASCFERDIASPNAGYICTARGVDSSTAISRLLYLISELMPDEWAKPQQRVKSDLW
jgi:hypothetical protein